MKMKILPILLLATLAISISGLASVAYAEDGEGASGMSDGSKLIGAGLAFGLAAMGAGIGLGYVGSAGLAVITENPALQSKVFIFIGMVESIAIYGICHDVHHLRPVTIQILFLPDRKILKFFQIESISPHSFKFFRDDHCYKHLQDLQKHVCVIKNI